MSPSAAADNVVASLKHYEALLREVHLAGSYLSIELRSAQIALGLSPIAGHGVLGAIDDTQSGISGAIGSVARAHSKLRVLAERIGIDPRSFGEQTDPEDNPEVKRQAGTSRLASVA